MFVLDVEEMDGKKYDGLHFAFRHFKAVVPLLLDMCWQSRCLGMFFKNISFDNTTKNNN